MYRAVDSMRKPENTFLKVGPLFAPCIQGIELRASGWYRKSFGQRGQLTAPISTGLLFEIGPLYLFNWCSSQTGFTLYFRLTSPQTYDPAGSASPVLGLQACAISPTLVLQVLYMHKVKSCLFLHYYENFHRVRDSFKKIFLIY